jgi:outer membrane protein assembly factor BamD
MAPLVIAPAMIALSSGRNPLRLVFLALATAALGLTAGCAGSKARKDVAYVARDVDTLYAAAKDRLDRGDAKQAAALFDEVERQHPYSAWAAKAQLMSAYASFKDQKFDQSIDTLDSFIVLHPYHVAVSYAYYLRALCYYGDIVSATKDQKSTHLALQAFADVVQRFPETSYARDCLLKQDFIRDHLAAAEMNIGRFYLKQKEYLAAINRFREVVVVYPRVTHVPEALHRLVECYLALGLPGEAQKSAAVLRHNFPENSWYTNSYWLLKGVDLRPEWVKDAEGSWLDNMVKGVF